MNPLPVQGAAQIAAGQTWELKERKETLLGQVIIDQVEKDLIRGRFLPAPEFAKVEVLFADFVEAANELLLHHVGELHDQIKELGLHLAPANGIPLPEIHEVQIIGPKITFRLRHLTE